MSRTITSKKLGRKKHTSHLDRYASTVMVRSGQLNASVGSLPKMEAFLSKPWVASIAQNH